MSELQSFNPEVDLENLPQRQAEFDKLYQENVSKLFKYAYKLSKNRDDAEDLLSKSIIKAWQAFDLFDRTKQFSNWMMSIIHNSFIDQTRSPAERVRSNTISYDGNPILLNTLGDDGSSADKAMQSRALTDKYQQAISALTQIYQDSINAHINPNSAPSHADTAAEADISIDVAKQRLSRARKMIRKTLSTDDENI
jgi:RNA polymerase sigma-70 factor (ECF subfamily)